MNFSSKTPLFLMEVVIMLLVFAISASICLKVFVEGNRISQESYNLDQACRQTQKAAEYWQSTNGDIKETAHLLQASIDGNKLDLFYDGEWNPVWAENRFVLSMKVAGARAEITVKDQEKEIFSIITEAVIYGE